MVGNSDQGKSVIAKAAVAGRDQVVGTLTSLDSTSGGLQNWMQKKFTFA